MADAAAKATKRVLDFTNVKDRGDFNPKHKAPGDYKLRIAAVTEGKSQQGNDMWTFTLTIPGDSTASYPYRCVLNENNIWKVRNLFIAAGVQVPKKRLAVDPNKIVGREIGGTLEDDEYEGKIKSVVESVFPVSDLDSDEPAGTGGEDEDVSDADLDEIEVDEL